MAAMTREEIKSLIRAISQSTTAAKPSDVFKALLEVILENGQDMENFYIFCKTMADIIDASTTIINAAVNPDSKYDYLMNVEKMPEC